MITNQVAVLNADQVLEAVKRRAEDFAIDGWPNPQYKVYLTFPNGRRKDTAVVKVIADEGTPHAVSMLTLAVKQSTGKVAVDKPFHRETTGRQKALYVHPVQYDDVEFRLAFSNFQQPTPEQWESVVAKTVVAFVDPR